MEAVKAVAKDRGIAKSDIYKNVAAINRILIKNHKRVHARFACFYLCLSANKEKPKKLIYHFSIWKLPLIFSLENCSSSVLYYNR